MKHPFSMKILEIAEVLHIHRGASSLHFVVENLWTCEVLHIHTCEYEAVEAPVVPTHYKKHKDSK